MTVMYSFVQSLYYLGKLLIHHGLGLIHMNYVSLLILQIANKYKWMYAV